MEDICLESARLTQMIKQQEDVRVELQKKLEEAVKRRNFLYVLHLCRKSEDPKPKSTERRLVSPTVA